MGYGASSDPRINLSIIVRVRAKEAIRSGGVCVHDVASTVVFENSNEHAFL